MAFRNRYTSQGDIKRELASFKLQRLDDIDRLLAIVSRCNDFNIYDYNRLQRQADISLYPTRLARLLKSRIYPLINKSNRKKKSNVNNASLNKTEYQHKTLLDVKKASDKLYKATNFKFEKGVIKCGKFKLQSVRIPKVDDSIIQFISEEFRIKAKYDGTFLFDPPSDLSKFLELIGKLNSKYVNRVPNINIIEVSVKDFHFTYYKNRAYYIWYKGYCCEFNVKKEWTKPAVTILIEQKFVISLEDNHQLRFLYSDDKDSLKELLKEAYLKFEQSEREKAGEKIIAEIEEKIKAKIEEKIRSFIYFKIHIPFNKFERNPQTLMFECVIDVMDYLDMSERNRTLHLSIEEIIKLSSSKYINYHEEAIKERWHHGYDYIVSVDEIHDKCNYNIGYDYFSKNTELRCKIPIIVIERMGIGNDANFIVIAKAYPEKIIVSYTIGYVSHFIPPHQDSAVYNHRIINKNQIVIFNKSIKESLKHIIPQYEGNYAGIFYSAYARMFNENDLDLGSSYSKYVDSCPPYRGKYSGKYFGLRGGGIYPLEQVDITDNTEWMWLISEMRRGRFIKAYKFYDLDKTLSSHYDETVSYIKRAYLAVNYNPDLYRHTSSENIDYHIYLYEFDTNKKIYRFSVKKENLEKSIFAIWAYFSSTNCNKRENIYEFLVKALPFGIQPYFVKFKSLSYLSGLGYYEEGWI